MDPMVPLAPMKDNVCVKIESKESNVIVAKMATTVSQTVNLVNVMKMEASTTFATKVMEFVDRVFQELREPFVKNVKLTIVIFQLAKLANVIQKEVKMMPAMF